MCSASPFDGGWLLSLCTAAIPAGVAVTLLGLSAQTTSGSTLKFTRDGDGDILSYRNAANAAFYYLTDHLGSVTGLFDSSGTWKGGYSYAPYGVIRHSSTDTAVTANTQRYIGGYYEGNGVYKLGARYYDAELGRFTQMDPSGQEANPYAYSSGNPVNSSDPTGLAGYNVGAFLNGLIVGGLATAVGFGFGLVCEGVAGLITGLTFGAGSPLVIACAVAGFVFAEAIFSQVQGPFPT